MLDKTGMPVVQVSTDEFWQKMCSFSSFRIDLHNIAIGMTIFHCDKPPELVVGFLDEKIEEIESKLNPPGLWTRLRSWVAYKTLMFRLRKK